jgi:hypothetical protein
MIIAQHNFDDHGIEHFQSIRGVSSNLWFAGYYYLGVLQAQELEQVHLCLHVYFVLEGYPDRSNLA